MRQEKMQLTLTISATMDKWAKRNKIEHNKVRLSKRARMHYRPSDWKNSLLTVRGEAKEDKLHIGQAAKADVKKHGAAKAKRLGFVTTATYNALMGKNRSNKSIWITEKSHKITLGCDPEFVVTDKDWKGIYGDTAMGYNFNDHAKKAAKFGSDGPCVELRPDPENEVDALIDSISALFKSPAAKKIEDYHWIGGASYRDKSMPRRYPIGGHIHFGLPNLPGAARNTNLMLQNQIVRVLDEMVALPLVRMDTPMPGERRSSLNYGKFNDIKRSNYKFEWRVPSGIWLIHPTVARSVLAVSKAVVEECWKRYEDRDCNHKFMLEPNRDDNLLKSFSCSKTEVVRSLVNSSKVSDVEVDLVRDIQKRARQMSTYPSYKDGVDDFFRLCSNTKTTPTKTQLLLKPGWLEDKDWS